MAIDIGEKMSMCVHIPYGKRYTANLTGATLKLVRCEKCYVECVLFTW
jgi:hypothetical protein